MPHSKPDGFKNSPGRGRFWQVGQAFTPPRSSKQRAAARSRWGRRSPCLIAQGVALRQEVDIDAGAEHPLDSGLAVGVTLPDHDQRPALVTEVVGGGAAFPARACTEMLGRDGDRGLLLRSRHGPAGVSRGRAIQNRLNTMVKTHKRVKQAERRACAWQDRSFAGKEDFSR